MSQILSLQIYDKTYHRLNARQILRKEGRRNDTFGRAYRIHDSSPILKQVDPRMETVVTILTLFSKVHVQVDTDIIIETDHEVRSFHSRQNTSSIFLLLNTQTSPRDPNRMDHTSKCTSN